MCGGLGHAAVGRILDGGRGELGAVGQPTCRTTAVCSRRIMTASEDQLDPVAPRGVAIPGDTPFFAVTVPEVLRVRMTTTLPSSATGAKPDIPGILHVPTLR